eukprot:TRINITY_DN7445_c0_g1_i1.p1 TRINITY_DN7445_c0_g1~~TRINITY_DN7445_c0_g1_i1.p1  ORF type:complete len:314 (-),score=68.05 TRINITY_DN7445_c0_g1_i1:113-1054(-)
MNASLIDQPNSVKIFQKSISCLSKLSVTNMCVGIVHPSEIIFDVMSPSIEDCQSFATISFKSLFFSSYSFFANEPFKFFIDLECIKQCFPHITHCRTLNLSIDRNEAGKLTNLSIELVYQAPFDGITKKFLIKFINDRSMKLHKHPSPTFPYLVDLELPASVLLNSVFKRFSGSAKHRLQISTQGDTLLFKNLKDDTDHTSPSRYSAINLHTNTTSNVTMKVKQDTTIWIQTVELFPVLEFLKNSNKLLKIQFGAGTFCEYYSDLTYELKAFISEGSVTGDESESEDEILPSFVGTDNDISMYSQEPQRSPRI